jgi:hypothetical protein
MWTHRKPTLTPKLNAKIQPLKSPTLNPKTKIYDVTPQKTNFKP